MTGFAVWSTRLHIASAMSPHILEGWPGIVCIGMQGNDGTAPLIVVWDETTDGFNDGCSATNCMGDVLRYLYKQWFLRMHVQQALIVQHDSDGAFDHVVPEWPSHPSARGIVQVHWRALRFPPAAPRTFEAFRWMYGTKADVALTAVRSLQERPFPSVST